MDILNNISTPEDLKRLSPLELQKLTREIRKFLIENVSKTGGHLASNLGVVELTIALHKVFESPKDKIIWDVGHQAYVHKLLTGRREQFSTLRKYKGLSGFPKRLESNHDIFETGHSSTSISAGLGIAMGRDLKGEKYHVISVIGDGALTGGMAFEALNHAGHSKTDLIVVLNDNEMSISENVGGLSKYLNRLRSDPTYFKVKDDVEALLSKIPAIGKSVVRTAQRTKDTIKYFFVPGIIFEELGFTYLGPVNGHNINELTDVFNRAKKIKGPVLIHTITKKGKGYKFAEWYPDKFHGVGPFDVDTGEIINNKVRKSYSNIFGEKLIDLADRNPNIVAITAAMPSGTGLSEFAQKHPDKIFDVGIAEQHGVTFAAGLAAAGLRPVFAVYSTFLQRGFDQVIHDVCLQNLPVIFGIDRAGLVGEDGETHHGIFDLSYLMPIPNLTIMAPKDGRELEEMLVFAFNHNGPVAIRYPRGESEDMILAQCRNKTRINMTEIMKEGSELCIIALGKMVKTALELWDLLQKEGVSASVLNARIVKPLDEETIISQINKAKYVITLEDNVIISGFGSRIVDLIKDKGITNKRIKTYGFPDKFIEHGNTSELFKVYGLDAQSLFKDVMKFIN